MRPRGAKRLAVLALVLGGGVARASDWTITNAVTGAPSSASTFGEGTYYAVSNSLIGRKTVGGSAMGAGRVTTGGPIENFPSVVPLADGKNYIFVASQNGYLYKIDAETMLVTQSRSLRRAGCPSDALQATPTVQLAAYSTGFTPGQDLVFVPTYHACGDTTQNQIIALRASDITAAAAWTFNSGEYEVDYFAEGCSLDYAANRLYCASNLASGAFQNTVWAISTIDGSLVWAANMNSVHARPQLSRGSDNHVYVADRLGTLHALDRNTGLENWSLPLVSVSGVYLETNLWAEFRAPYNGLLFVTDSGGTLHAIYDTGPYPDGGIEAWTSSTGSAKVMSLASVSPTLGKLYVGLDDGTVHQLDLASGSDEATRTVATTAGAGQNVTDPALHITSGGSDIDRLVVSVNQSGGKGTLTKQFVVPWNVTSTGSDLLTCTTNADCVTLNTPRNCVIGSSTNDCCAVGRCNTQTNTCYASPPATTKACNDSKGSCTSNKACYAGACIGKWTGTCTGRDACTTDARRACGAGKTCKSSAAGGWTCIDLRSADFCGGLDRSCKASTRQGAEAWGGDRSCNQGMCERDTNAFTLPSPTQISSLVQGANHAEIAPDTNGDMLARISLQGTPGNGGGLCDVVPGQSNGSCTRKYLPSGVQQVMNSGTYEVAGAQSRIWATTYKAATPKACWVNTMVPQGNGGTLEILTINPMPDYHTSGGTTCMSAPVFAPSGQEAAYFGNYISAGDVYKVFQSVSGGWVAHKVLDGGSGGARAWSLAFGADGLLRVAVGPDVKYVNVSGVTATKPGTVVRTVSIDTGWYGASQYHFFYVRSISTDPLGLSNQLYLTAAKGPNFADSTMVLVLNENDYSLRFQADVQKDVWNATWPPPTSTPNPPAGVSTYLEDNVAGRGLTALYRMFPGGSSGNTVRRLSMPR